VFRNNIKLLLYVGTGLLLILSARAFLFHGDKKEEKTYKLKVAGKEVTVELALTTWEHQRGLKYRHWLPEDYGMLFIFPEEENHSFWMKDTYIPISIAFISSGGIITQIDSMEPLSLKGHTSKEKVKYALEMNGGWFEQHNVRIGDKVDLLPGVAKN
jgi:uncharacterized membrane protein (UPF0127 family)